VGFELEEQSGIREDGKTIEMVGLAEVWKVTCCGYSTLVLWSA